MNEKKAILPPGSSTSPDRCERCDSDQHVHWVGDEGARVPLCHLCRAGLYSTLGVCEREEYETREEWLAARKTGIGASEAAAVLGYSKFATPLQVWLKKTGRESDEIEETPYLRRGRALEPVVAKEYEEETGRRVFAPGCRPFVLFRSKEIPFLVATPDRFQYPDPIREGQPGALELKTVAARLAGEWGEPDEAKAPLAYRIQLQHQLRVLGFDWGTVCALVVGDFEFSLRTFDEERNETFVDAMLRELSAFWRCVEKDEEPPAEAQDLRAVRTLREIDETLTVDLDAEAVEMAETWGRLGEERSELTKAAEILKKRREKLEARIRQAMGAASLGRLPDGRAIKLSVSHVGEYTVAASERHRMTLRKAPKKA